MSICDFVQCFLCSANSKGKSWQEMNYHDYQS
nr:MAG TPA: protein of unknown function (DUF4667) [Caudoviricetes sp.]